MLLTDQSDLVKAEPKTLRYRLLHIAARITRGPAQDLPAPGRALALALALAKAFTRLRTIPLPA